jgi:hypothetical protein
MEIVNTKVIKRFVIYFSGISAILVVIPILIYFKKFNGKLSNDPQDWGDLGGYIGGIIGSFFSLLSIIFSLIGIYITLKIATHIHNIELLNNEANAEREIKKFEKETDLISKQYKPYPHIDFNVSRDILEIILSNQGPGTIIITDWKITYEGQHYENFLDIILSYFPEGKFDDIYMTWERAQRICINSGAERNLFEVIEDKNKDCDFIGFSKEFEKLLCRCDLLINYQDIFETKYTFLEKINF